MRATSSRSTVPALLLLGALAPGCRAAPARGPAASEVSGPEALLAAHDLRSLVAPEDELGSVLRVRRWVHQRWAHHSSHTPERYDSLEILRAAAAGERFRCAEYAFVLADAYLALGWPARIVRFEGDGAHVATEVRLRSLGKWVLMDPQFDAHVLGEAGAPLSGLELQAALREGRAPGRVVSDYPGAGEYLQFVASYGRYLMVTSPLGFGAHYRSLRVLVQPGDAAPTAKPPYLEANGAIYQLTEDAAELYPVAGD